MKIKLYEVLINVLKQYNIVQYNSKDIKGMKIGSTSDQKEILTGIM